MLIKWLVYRRLPWVCVLEPRDCGASVFASIAGYYQHHISLEQARNLVGTDRDGTTLAGLRDGGRAIGLDARPAHAIYEALEHVPLPAIAHLDGREGHYVVLYRWSPSNVIVLDPNRGVLKMDREKFESVWSGYLVEYRATPRLQPRAPDVRPLHVFGQFMLEHKAILLIALLFSLIATSLGLAASFFLRTLVDQILPNRDMQLLVALGLGLVLVSTFQAGLQLGRLWLCALVGRRIHVTYGLKYIRHLLCLPMKVFDARCVPGLVMRITQTEMIQQSITEGMVGLVSDGAMFLAALIVIMIYDPFAALIAFCAVPLILLITLILNDRVYTSQLASMVRAEEFGAHMVDTFDSVRTIKVFSAEDRYQNLLAAKLDVLADARYKNRTDLALPTAWSLFATSLITAGLLWYASSRVMSGHITVGELLVLFGMVSFYLIPVQRFPATVLGIRGALIGIERLEEIRLLPAEAARTTDPIALPAVRGQIRFDQVCFAYKHHRPVLNEVSFTINPGETIAIVGETGSGKTSLANLIAGFYLPTKGEVYIDGVSTRQLRPAELRQSVSAVFQNSRLLQQSVRENITLMDDVPIDAVHRAAQVAHADSFIDALINRYDTQVARGGDNFSSGQAQRIALARALLKNAPILILDEATSNLDGATEQGVLQALEDQQGSRTTILIAHRLSTVLRADRIFVMDQGQIVESGTHEELLRKRAHYYRLFRWQVDSFSSYSYETTTT